MGLAYHRNGNYELAKSLMEEALLIKRNKLPPKDIKIANANRSLGAIYSSLFEYKKGIKHTGKALDIQTSVYSKYHPVIIGTMCNLGAMHHFAKHYKESEKYYRKCLHGCYKTR